MGHLDPKQLPSKRKPWTTLLEQDFVHKVELVLPQELLAVVRTKLDERMEPQYQRVIMSLADILDRGFFTQYIKDGNTMMLSEGTIGVENVYAVRKGHLTMYLEKDMYERAGLVGKPHGVKGKRGLKPRWIVEYDLTISSMRHGKKGFDRLVYAARNVLNTPVTWLFCHLAGSTPDPDPLSSYMPATFTSTPALTQNLKVAIPPLKPGADIITSSDKLDMEEFASELYEWLSLVRLSSPRVEVGDRIDPYLCRYSPPGDATTATKGALCKLSWTGFIPSSWPRQLLIDTILAVPSRAWFAMSATTLSQGMLGNNSEITILRPTESPGEYLLWEVKSHE